MGRLGAAAVVAVTLTGCGQTVAAGPGTAVPSAPLARASSSVTLPGALSQSPADLPSEAPASDPAGCTGTPSRASSLAPGAQSVRLCDASGQGLGLSAPQDLLTSSTDAVVAAFNALPAATGQETCTTDIAGTYRLEIRYVDQTVTLDGQAFGCRTIGGRLGSDKVLAAFSKALLEQRGTTRPSGSAHVSPSCRASWVPARVADATGAWLCSGLGQVVGEISAADWSVIGPDLQTGLRPGTPSGSCTGPSASLLVRDGYGSVRELQLQCGGWVTQDADGQSQSWTPGPQAQPLMKAWLEKV